MAIEDPSETIVAAQYAKYEARIAELEAFIKVLLPSWPDGYEYLSEMSVLQMQQNTIDDLKGALREALAKLSVHDPMTADELRSVL